ncbi:NapC/NirT family cytochrome c [Psychrobacter sp. FDAARGOS_221]|uniref:NapC/NirT family cytochrome c n=1 Tax=Psychrobacter sp. FDAARGOS_221 TaxID=1975705 RepID=UPI000BB58367|nr:NapC/NirT family cytochrome c [Psychrobacter sp. FDAARGOS_221]PNK60166.1 cytochrome C [Psychrobacter sp. FDAARGOS_221]
MDKLGKKGLILLVAIAMLIGAIALYLTQWSLEATSTNDFCVSCHSMESAKLEWEGSNHFSNSKGIQAGCADCHIPHDTDWNYFKTKTTTGLKDVYHEIMGGIPDAEAYEEKRGEMAKRVWADMKKNDSVTCRSCHQSDVWDIYAQSNKARQEHLLMEQQGSTCIDCHRGVAHFPPEFTESAKEAGAKLNQLVAQTSNTAKTLYPIAEAALFSDDKADEKAGRIFPGVNASVVSSQNDMQQLKVEGFQQQGAEQVIYTAFGKRIVGAVLNDELLDKLEVNGDYTLDKDSNSQWRPVSITAWAKKDNLIDDVDGLWAYGNELNNAYCGGCHAVIPASHYTANQWAPIVEGMVGRTSLSESDQMVLTYYLQNAAKDMKGEGNE